LKFKILYILFLDYHVVSKSLSLFTENVNKFFYKIQEYLGYTFLFLSFFLDFCRRDKCTTRGNNNEPPFEMPST